MADIEVHTAYGWKPLGDLIQATIKCDKCGETVPADGDGFVKCDPPENIIYFCRECRKSHG